MKPKASARQARAGMSALASHSALQRDQAFWSAHAIVGRYQTWRAAVEGAAGQLRPQWAEIEAAAQGMADFHRAFGDSHTLALIIARCRWFHDRCEPLPQPLVALLLDLAASATPGRRGRGNPGADIAERATRRGHAAHVQWSRDQGQTLDEAVGSVAAFGATAGAKSEESVRDHYRWAIADQGKVEKPE